MVLLSICCSRFFSVCLKSRVRIFMGGLKMFYCVWCIVFVMVIRCILLICWDLVVMLCVCG